jgi:hypothetical protein
MNSSIAALSPGLALRNWLNDDTPDQVQDGLNACVKVQRLRESPCLLTENFYVDFAFRSIGESSLHRPGKQTNNHLAGLVSCLLIMSSPLLVRPGESLLDRERD